VLCEVAILVDHDIHPRIPSLPWIHITLASGVSDFRVDLTDLTKHY
jgi:hypothetical protein